MTKTTGESPEPIDLKSALESDVELSNEHIYQNDPKTYKPADEVLSEDLENQSSGKPFKPSNKKSVVKQVAAWLLGIVVILSAGVGGLWVYANKSVLFPTEQVVQTTPFTKTGYEVSENKSPHVAPNLYVTEGALREFSRSIRKELKNALSEVSEGLDAVDTLQRKTATLHGDLNELKLMVSQVKNNPESIVSAEQYQEILAKLHAIDTALSESSNSNELLSDMKNINKKRKLLERQLTNNDWDLRMRMEKLEDINGVVRKKSYVESSIKPKKKVPAKNKYPAYMTRSDAKVTPVMEKRVIYEKVNVDSSKKVVWKNKHRWKIRMISNALTQIQDIDTKEKLTISEGVEVSGCGIVLDIDVADRIITTQYCKVTRQGS